MTFPTFYNPGLDWHCFRTDPLSPERDRAIERRMERILSEWEHTPYCAGQAVKQAGVYCTAFVSRLLDELYRRSPTPLLEIPIDISFHNTAGAVAGLRWFRRQYPNHITVENGSVEPGDVIVTGPVNGGPGHAIFVGPQENTLWEARSAGVCKTGLMIPNNYFLHTIFRFTDRHLWL